MIGCGSFGTVSLGFNRDNGQIMAVKQTPILNPSDMDVSGAHCRESKRLNKKCGCSHNCVINTLCSITEPPEIPSSLISFSNTAQEAPSPVSSSSTGSLTKS